MNIYTLFGTTFIISILEYGIALFGNVIITKTLTVSDYGTYNFLNSVSGLILTFFSLGFSQYNYKIIPGRDIKKQDEIIGNSLFIELLSSIFGIILFGFLFKNKLVYSLGIIFFVIRILLNVFNSELIRCLGYRKKNFLKSIISFINERLWIIFFATYIILNKSEIVKLDIILFLQLITSFTVFLVLLILFKSKVLIKNFRFSYAFLTEHVKISISFVFVDLGMYLLEVGIRYVFFIKNKVDFIAYYSFSYNWVSVIFKFGMLLIYILQPYFSNEYYLSEKSKTYPLKKLYLFENFALKYSLYIIFGALFFLMINYDDFVILLGKSEYLITKKSFYYLTPLPVFMCIAYFFQILIVLSGKTKIIPIIYFIMVVGVLISNFIFIDKFGYYFSSIITSISYIFLAISFFIFCPSKMYNFKIKFNNILFFLLQLIVYFLGLKLLTILIHSSSIKIISQCFFCIITLFFIYLVNKKDFKFLKEIKFA